MSAEPVTFLSRPLYDGQGRRNDTLPGASQYFDEETVFILDRVNPGVSRRFVHVYEVAKDAKDFAVGVSNLRLLERKEAVIELGF